MLLDNLRSAAIWALRICVLSRFLSRANLSQLANVGYLRQSDQLRILSSRARSTAGGIHRGLRIGLIFTHGTSKLCSSLVLSLTLVQITPASSPSCGTQSRDRAWSATAFGPTRWYCLTHRDGGRFDPPVLRMRRMTQ